MLEGEEVVASVATVNTPKNKRSTPLAVSHRRVLHLDHHRRLRRRIEWRCLRSIWCRWLLRALDSSGTVLFFMEEANYGEAVTHQFCLPAIPGCTDEDMQLQRRCQHQRWFVLFTGRCLRRWWRQPNEDVVNFNCECVELRASLDARTMTRATTTPRPTWTTIRATTSALGASWDPCSLMQGTLPRT